MDSNDTSFSLSNEEYGFDVLKDIERQTSDNIRRQRSHDRMVIKAKVILQPGNTSDLLALKMQGITGDISSGGCRAMFPIPPKVGDIYRLHFEKQVLNLPMVFARCMRCKLVSEEAFEVGFLFFSPITLPDRIETEENTSLI